MRYSLRTLFLVMLLGGPGLAMLWWLKHTWTVQVFGILVLELAAMTFVVGLGHAIVWVVNQLIKLIYHGRRKPG